MHPVGLASVVDISPSNVSTIDINDGVEVDAGAGGPTISVLVGVLIIGSHVAVHRGTHFIASDWIASDVVGRIIDPGNGEVTINFEVMENFLDDGDVRVRRDIFLIAVPPVPNSFDDGEVRARRDIFDIFDDGEVRSRRDIFLVAVPPVPVGSH